MKEISINDIDVEKLKKVSTKSTESIVFLDEENNQIYKFFRSYLCSFEILLKRIKLDILQEKREISEIVIPDAMIMNKSIIGTRESYIEGLDLVDIKSKYQDAKTILDILLNVSKSIYNIHQNEIVISDLNFGNIRIDNDDNPRFLDILSAEIDNIPSNTISLVLNKYYKINNQKDIINKNGDKISFMLLIFNLIFDKNMFNISSYEYDKMKEKISFLHNIEDIFYLLTKKQDVIPEIPYLHELVEENKEVYIYENKMR